MTMLPPYPKSRNRDFWTVYPDAVQETADEADADLHVSGCMADQEHDADACTCALRWTICRALASEEPAALDVNRLADAIHQKLCGPFATIDPQECVHGRQRDVLAAAAVADTYRLATVESRDRADGAALDGEGQ